MNKRKAVSPEPRDLALAAAFCEVSNEHAFVFRLSDGEVLGVGEALCRRLGWSREELTRCGARVMWREPADYACFVFELPQQRAATSRVELFVTPRGETIELPIRARAVRSDDDELAVVMAEDAADRQRLQAQYKEAALARDGATTELSTILNAVGDGVITTDGGGRVLTLNGVAERLTHWSQHEAVGRPLREVFRVNRLGRGGPVPDPLSDVLNRRRDAASWPRATLIARDGTEREIAESVSALRRPDGDGFGVVVVFRDMAAQARLDTELQKNQRLEAVGVLASGIAHDINNVLTGILGNLSVARHHTGDSFVQMRLAAGENAALIIRGMTRQLLTLARGNDPARGAVTLRAIIDEATSIALSGSSCRAKVTLEDEGFALYADASQLTRLLQNLVLNAVQAMPDGGVVEISATRLANGQLDGEFVRIAVRDHGSGIPESLRDRIFEPYFTTKPSGSGLGLAVAQSIVARHAGWLDYESTPNGTTFECVLPLLSEADHVTPPEPPSREPVLAFAGPRRGLRVLLLEDDPAVSEATLQMLHELGSVTVHAQTGEEALSAFERAREKKDRDAQPFDVLLVDLTLRGATGGVTCLARLRAAGCTAPAVLTSGYARPEDAAVWRKEGFDAALPKPYSLGELRTAIDQLTPAPRRSSVSERPPAPPPTGDGLDEARIASARAARQAAFDEIGLLMRHEVSTMLHVARASLDVCSSACIRNGHQRLAALCERSETISTMIDAYSTRRGAIVSRLRTLQHPITLLLRARAPENRIEIDVAPGLAELPLAVAPPVLSLAIVEVSHAFALGSPGIPLRVALWVQSGTGASGRLTLACSAYGPMLSTWGTAWALGELQAAGATVAGPTVLDDPESKRATAVLMTIATAA